MKKEVEQSFKETLFNDILCKEMEFSERDLFGAITGEPEVLKKYGWDIVPQSSINKGYLVTSLGDYVTHGSQEAFDYLVRLLFENFCDDFAWGSNNFAAVSWASREIRETCKNREQLIDIFIEALKHGNYAAKFVICYEASYMVEDRFIEPMKDLITAVKDSDQELYDYATRQLNSLLYKLSAGLKQVNLETALKRIPRLQFEF